ncbi:uncharacterized protein LOC115435007 [Sphaeramia orbicularis]|uniref:uncharacterized protein LOC115435007 n=1 Tax=Sphaeramia orbicularis TaxID=375764 RepID=UPI00117F3C2C|nr:uncharacterized protein LOC115435007 [Sphaeramia orbicularis]
MRVCSMHSEYILYRRRLKEQLAVKLGFLQCEIPGLHWRTNLRSSFLDQMGFLIELSLILLLTFISKGHTWNISVTKHFNVTSGSDVNILCTFSYPPKYHSDNVQIFWKKFSKEKITINDVDKRPFIFHPNETYIIEKYRHRTKLIGNVKEGNCSLKIQNITENEPKIYLRVAVADNYSFVEDYVSISVSGVPPVIIDQDIPLVTAPPKPSEQSNNIVMYIAIFVPLAAALIIIVATGTVCFKKHRSLSRRESSYYVNFKVSSTPAKRETSFKKQDNKELPEQKVIDDPVYINLEVNPGQMDQSVAHADNIYANVDYTQ